MASQEIGLEFGLLLGKYLLNSEQLHYGYWPDDLPVNLMNFADAQDNYMQFILSRFPENVKTILDVGCGAGVFAEKLVRQGYTVNCITPSNILYSRAVKRLGSDFPVFQGYFEDFQSQKCFDLILFSESFQYIKLHKAIDLSFHLLNPGGYLLICDFFKRKTAGRSPIGGGHTFSKFIGAMSQYAFTPITDVDITRRTAPTITLANDFLEQVGRPTWEMAHDYLHRHRPLLSKLLYWKYRNKIEKIARKYFRGLRTAESFEKYKTYRFLLYQK